MASTLPSGSLLGASGPDAGDVGEADFACVPIEPELQRHIVDRQQVELLVVGVGGAHASDGAERV